MTTESQDPFFREIDIEFLIHELKDPVSVIETSARLLLERKSSYGPLSSRQEKTLKRMLRNAQKARAMIYGLLEVGGAQTGAFTPTRFSPVTALHHALIEALEIADTSVFDQAHAAATPEDAFAVLMQHHIHVEIAPEVFHTELFLDETKFGRIVGNLIKNALHHRHTQLHIAMKHHDNTLWTDITDDGPGVAPQHHALIFKRYTRLHADGDSPRTGHGLGLAGALVLARSMGGDIGIVSQKGHGATFRLKLPIKHE